MGYAKVLETEQNVKEIEVKDRIDAVDVTVWNKSAFVDETTILDVL